ncbi:hypothetical protein [Ekhidna sp.]|jgi:hypothetical protein|uniref:hypothetical protein n=1 Tax=Ekhidna sp. TaxID=2608089 RepID=UPI0032EEA7B9
MGATDDFFEFVSIHNNYNTLSFRFFMAFSRFEYALKRAGFVHTPANGSIAQASIQDFGDLIQNSIDLNDKSIKNCADHIFNNPPNVLLQANDGRLHWIALTPFSRSVTYLIKCMRTTRNNLFHGNKQLPGNDITRNVRLISSFFPILDCLIESHPQVQGFFLEGLEE